MSEKQIEKKFVARCKELGLYTRKFSSPSHRGVPDRIVIAPDGRIMFVELKADYGRTSALQEREMAELRKYRQCACVVSGFAGAMNALDLFAEGILR